MQTATHAHSTDSTVHRLLQPQPEQQYQLPAEVLESILSASAEGRRTLLILRQRQAFIKIHGDPFGAEVL